MLFGFPLISLVIWLPILIGILVFATGGDHNARLAKWVALVGSTLSLLVAIPLYTQFDPVMVGMQFVEYHTWIERFNVHYHLGVDGISMPLILLNCFITPLVVIAGWQVINSRVSQYMGAFLVMSGIVNGVFSSLDAILFYVFWEASLIPMFLIIGVWGGPNRVYAAIKFFLYTLMGSLLMLVAFIYLYNISGGSFSILDYHKLSLPLTPQILIFIAFLIAFAVKVPMWPFLRYSLPIVPDASQYLSGMMIGLSLIAVVYIGLIALIQADMKKLIAYSSVSHMGFVTLGFFLFNAYGIEGAMVQMISHGFISGAMFFCVGVMYDRLHSRQISDYGGVANKMPVFAAFFMLFAMANAGLPGTSGFVGEFMVIMASIKVNFWYAFFAATTLIFGAAYTLWMYKRVVFGAVVNSKVEELTDVSYREIFILMILAVAVLWMGVYPLPLTEVMHATVDDLLAHLSRSKL
jgi:NADH-quinone oxidoreductase subunit M